MIPVEPFGERDSRGVEWECDPGYLQRVKGAGPRLP